MSESEVLKGVVKWFNDAKGFGFIQHTSGRDVFVHYSVISSDGFKTLKDGETVEYELKEGPKGLQAAKVVRPEKVEEPASEAIPTTSRESDSSVESAE
jgi:CspA family cold shock protein